MTDTAAAVEWAMKVQEVILRALSGQLSWAQVDEVLGVSARTIRRLRWRYARWGYKGLLDRRRRLPSPRRVPVQWLEPFCQVARREHGLTFSYTLVKRRPVRELGWICHWGRRALRPHTRRPPRNGIIIPLPGQP